MENNTFIYSYSAERNKEIESIRKKYIAHEESKLERLKRLDMSVQSAGVIEALCLGIVGILTFGIGMCFFLEVFTGSPVLTAVLMILGAILMAPAYPVYKRLSRRKKEALTPEILTLSDEILNS